jgi:hypothetical protein
MSNAELLSIRLFLGSVCMFSFALGVNQAGWRHRSLIVSLFALSVISGLGAVIYPSVGNGWPIFTSSLESIASNAWTWFGLVALLSISVLALSIRDRVQARVASQPSAIAWGTPEITRPATSIPANGDSPGLTRARELMDLCVGRTDVEMKQITSDYAGEPLEVSSIVYNVRTFSDASASISIDLDPTQPRLIHARIVGKDQAVRAVALRKGDKIKVSGKISEISNITIVLIDCEFTRF